MTVPKPPRQRKLTGAQYAARFKAEAARLQARYCEALSLWRDCGRKRCRREGACRGDPSACLKRALDVVPQDAQWRAREKILAETPANIGAPERAARQRLPRDFYTETAAEVVANDPALR